MVHTDATFEVVVYNYFAANGMHLYQDASCSVLMKYVVSSRMKNQGEILNLHVIHREVSQGRMRGNKF